MDTTLTTRDYRELTGMALAMARRAGLGRTAASEVAADAIGDAWSRFRGGDTPDRRRLKAAVCWAVRSITSAAGRRKLRVVALPYGYDSPSVSRPEYAAHGLAYLIGSIRQTARRTAMLLSGGLTPDEAGAAQGISRQSVHYHTRAIAADLMAAGIGRGG